MLNTLRVYWHRRKTRFTLFYHRSDFEGVELMIALAMLWQSYYFATLGGRLDLFGGSGPHVGDGAALIADSAAFWSSRLPLGWASLAALCVSLASLYGLVEEHTRVRYAAMLFAQAWWVSAWYIMIVNTPRHAGGGLYFVMAIATYWVARCLNVRRFAEASFLRRAFAFAVEERLIAPEALRANY